MAQKLRFIVVMSVCVILVLLAVNVAASNSRPPRNNDISNMADALKYLQDLDTYYGDRARVRFGKRVPLAQLLRNRMLDTPDQVNIQALKRYSKTPLRECNCNDLHNLNDPTHRLNHRRSQFVINMNPTPGPATQIA